LQTAQKSCRFNSTNFVTAEQKIENYFPPLNVPTLDWVRDPFVLQALDSEEVSVAEEDVLTEIRNDRRM
jgi:hypothetical protein